MAFIKRDWTPAEADEWTKEDVITVILSPLTYILIPIGLALALFGLWYGFVMFAIGIIISCIMFWIINPKLSTISKEYEKKQKTFLENLERIIRWEDTK